MSKYDVTERKAKILRKALGQADSVPVYYARKPRQFQSLRKDFLNAKQTDCVGCGFVRAVKRCTGEPSVFANRSAAIIEKEDGHKTIVLYALGWNAAKRIIKFDKTGEPLNDDMLWLRPWPVSWHHEERAKHKDVREIKNRKPPRKTKWTRPTINQLGAMLNVK